MCGLLLWFMWLYWWLWGRGVGVLMIFDQGLGLFKLFANFLRSTFPEIKTKGSLLSIGWRFWSWSSGVFEDQGVTFHDVGGAFWRSVALSEDQRLFEDHHHIFTTRVLFCWRLFLISRHTFKDHDFFITIAELFISIALSCFSSTFLIKAPQPLPLKHSPS